MHNQPYNVHYDQSNVLPAPPTVGHPTPVPGHVPLRPASFRGMGGVVDKYPYGWYGIAGTAVALVGLIWFIRR